MLVCVMWPFLVDIGISLWQTSTSHTTHGRKKTPGAGQGSPETTSQSAEPGKGLWTSQIKMTTCNYLGEVVLLTVGVFCLQLSFFAYALFKALIRRTFRL